MSILQAANVHFVLNGTSRIQSPTGNDITIIINSANTLHIGQGSVVVTGDINVTGNIRRNGAVSSVASGGVPNQVYIKNSTTDGDGGWANTGSPVLLLIEGLNFANSAAIPVSGYNRLLVDVSAVGALAGGSAFCTIHFSSDGGSGWGPARELTGTNGFGGNSVFAICTISNIANTGNKEISSKGILMTANGAGHRGSTYNVTVVESSITSPITHVKVRADGGGNRFTVYGIR